ncbi:uncharacterized protein LOC778732 isoform X1 [Ciona intestinalis]
MSKAIESATRERCAEGAINLSKNSRSSSVDSNNDVPEDLTGNRLKKTNGLHEKSNSNLIFVPQSIVEQHNSGQALSAHTTAAQPIPPYLHHQRVNSETGKRSYPEDDVLSIDNESEDQYQPSPDDINDLDMHRGHGYDLEEAKQLEQLELFAKDFKQKRIKMGFTQGDVGQAMGCLYGNDFSQTTISRFEALNLSFKNMIKLKPMLERWLLDANNVLRESKDGQSVVIPTPIQLDPISISRKRKKRTSIDAKKRTTLDKQFERNPKPSSEDLQAIAEECKMEKEVVRVWFCNRRQKQKRISQHEQQVHEEMSPPDSPRNMVVPTTSYSVPWQFPRNENEPSTSNNIRRQPAKVNDNSPIATVKSFTQPQIKQENHKSSMSSTPLPSLFSHQMLPSNPNQVSPTLLISSAAVTKSKEIFQAVSARDPKHNADTGLSATLPSHLLPQHTLDNMAYNPRLVQPNHSRLQSKQSITSVPIPATTVLNSLFSFGNSFPMSSNVQQARMPTNCVNTAFTMNSKSSSES